MSVPVLTFDRPAKGEIGVDLPKLIASRMLLQANSGGGKSRALRYLLEQTFGKVQHLVLDPEGEFASLREAFPYVLAGKGADTAATPATAKLLCRKLMELGVSAVVDLYELPLQQRRSFVRIFLEELMHLPHALWHPVIVVLDEAHNFAPERSSGDAESGEAVIALATQGRKRGYCLVAATQRISKLHKDVAAELINKMIGRTGLDIDVKRAGDELGMQKDERDGLKRLTPGEFYVYGPAISNEVTLIRTGPVVTTHPEAGAASAPLPPAPEKVRKVLAQLADLPKEAADEARSIEDLRKVNRELESKLRRAEKGAPAPVDKEAIARTVEQAVARSRATWDRDAGKQRADAVRGARRLQSSLANVATILSVAVPESIGHLLASLEAPSAVPLSSVNSNGHRPVPIRAVAGPQPRRIAAPRPPGEPGTITKKGERICMAVIAKYPDGVTRKQLTVTTGYKRSTRDAYVQRLAVAGNVELRSDRIIATDDGIAALGSHYEALPTGRELLDHYLATLPEGQSRILAMVADAHPEPVGRDALTETLGYQRSTRDAYLQRLGARQLVDAQRAGVVRLSDSLAQEIA